MIKQHIARNIIKVSVVGLIAVGVAASVDYCWRYN
jgi:uncharacterized protein YraI